jgi:hypothetical protein
MIDVKDMETIDDGYTLDGFILGQPGVYEDLSFRYRPLSPIDERRYAVKRRTVMEEAKLSDEEKEIQLELLTVEMVLKNTGWWNLKDQAGNPAEKKVSSVILLFPGIRYARLMQIVRDGYASDPRPENTEPAKSLEELEKNSRPA